MLFFLLGNFFFVWGVVFGDFGNFLYVGFGFSSNVWVFTGGLGFLCFLRTFFLVIAYFLLDFFNPT